MQAKRILFWAGFVVILTLIIWGLVAAMKKDPNVVSKVGVPAPVTADDHVRGNPAAPITLIEYGDFQCPACETYFYIAERIFNESSSTMRMVFRHFPLSQHPNAMPAALASEAAAAQGKFWEMYGKIYENQDAWSEKPQAEAKALFESYAAELGLDVARFALDQDSSALRDKVQASTDEGIHVGIDHTPSFFVNGKEVNPQAYEDFKSIIESAASSTTQ
jgi:formate-nitrite transporter family protein